MLSSPSSAAAPPGWEDDSDGAGGDAGGGRTTPEGGGGGDVHMFFTKNGKRLPLTVRGLEVRPDMRGTGGLGRYICSNCFLFLTPPPVDLIAHVVVL